MKLFHAKGGSSAALCLALVYCLMPLMAQAAEDSPIFSSKGITFKLHLFQVAEPDMLVPDGWHLPKPVDSSLVDQIGRVRTALPCWSGLHHLAPGGAGAFR